MSKHMIEQLPPSSLFAQSDWKNFAQSKFWQGCWETYFHRMNCNGLLAVPIVILSMHILHMSNF